MIAHAKKLFLCISVASCLLWPSLSEGQEGFEASRTVKRVVDGDTLVLADGERVRLLGIDAPEKGATLFVESTRELHRLLSNGEVTFRFCGSRDVYDRLLARVFAGGVDVNREMLLSGSALPMLVPPCGTPIAEMVLEAAARGAASGKGIYSLSGYGIISHRDAGRYIGSHGIVKGRVVRLHRGPGAWHLNFGEDYRTDFTAVLFGDGRRRYEELGVDPGRLVGREVLVLGKIRRYNGPEIVIRGPEQILPLTGMSMEDPDSPSKLSPFDELEVPTRGR